MSDAAPVAAGHVVPPGTAGDWLPAPRIALCIASLEPGGAERVAATLASHWAARGRDVTVVTLADRAAAPFFALDGVSSRALGLAAPSRSAAAAVLANARRVMALRRALKSIAPDVIVSFVAETNVLCLMATRGLGIPLVICEHSDPVDWRLDWRWERLRRFAYRHATHAVALTRRGAEAVERTYGVHCTRIPNPLSPQARPRDTKREAGAARRLLAVGRLSPEKRYDRLLEVFAVLHVSHPAWTLTLAGDGPDADRLARYARELGIEHAARLPGWVDDPLALMRESDLFVHTSVTEAFPMVVCEAMACGLPVVVTEYNEGVHEIVEHGVDGVVVPRDDFDLLARELARLMDDAPARDRLSANAERIRERFSLARIDDQWDALFGSLT